MFNTKQLTRMDPTYFNRSDPTLERSHLVRLMNGNAEHSNYFPHETGISSGDYNQSKNFSSPNELDAHLTKYHSSGETQKRAKAYKPISLKHKLNSIDWE